MRTYSIHIILLGTMMLALTSCGQRSIMDAALMDEIDHCIVVREQYAVWSAHQVDSLYAQLDKPMSREERFELYGQLLEAYRLHDLDSQLYYTKKRLELAQTPFEQQMVLLNYAEVQMRLGDYPQMTQWIDSALQQPLNPALAPYYFQTLYPVIEQAYFKQTRKRQLGLIGLIISTLIILGMVTLFLIYVHRKHRQLAILNARLVQSNEELRRSNHIKSVYVKRFMKMTNIQDFDDAFLELFPDFVAQVQSLLVPEAELRIKAHERLNTDLRVLALIYLGITDSKQIADILRYSLPTIYNSRTRMRNLAKEDRDGFEQRITTL